MRIGLFSEEYVELRLKPRAGADRVLHQAADEQWEEMFPMNNRVFVTLFSPIDAAIGIAAVRSDDQRLVCL